MKLLSINSVAPLSIIVIFASCVRPAPVPPGPFFSQIYYKSKNGEDLLNPQTPGSFNKDGIKVFDVVVNANGIPMNNPSSFNEANCNDHYVCQPDNTGLYSIQFVFFPRNELKGALIQLSSSVADTLTYQRISTTPDYSGFYIYYKGQLLWSKSMPNVNTMTIVNANKMTIVK